MPTTTIKPKKVTKKFLETLPTRARDVVSHRFGLLPSSVEQKTLEAIGKMYGITRERVRQIENSAISVIKKSENFKKEKDIFDELEKTLFSMGAIVSEEELLPYLSKDKSEQNHFNFFMTLGDSFKKHKEDSFFKHRWSVNDETSNKVHDSLRKLYESLSHDDLVGEVDLIQSFLTHLKDISDEYKKEEVLKRWLSLSKNISKNKLGEWGKSDSSHIKARGIKDYAYLVIRKYGRPMHFSEVAKEISKLFGREAHVATCHNELIKDKRFVLVGRGMYALSSWGHTGGIVRDVIINILEKSKKPLSKNEIIKEVLKDRIVKENTILVNLQNQDFFKKTKEGLYSLK